MSRLDEPLELVGGHVLMPDGSSGGIGRVTIENGEVTAFELSSDTSASNGKRLVDISGAYLSGGFVDLHTETGEPGNEHKEDLESMGRSASHGGFTSVCTSPFTTPVNDSCAVTRHLIDRADIVSTVKVLPVATLTVGGRGERLTEMFDIKSGGAVAFGDVAGMLADSGLMRRAMEYARAVRAPVFETPVDPNLARDGVMHEGQVSTRLGLAGIPYAAENVATHRAIILAEATGARVHIGPISTRDSVEELRSAKAKGLQVTASVMAAHLHLTDEAIAEAWSPNLNVRPPFRTEADRHALLAGIADGTIDAVTSGHSPQSAVEKDVPFGRAVPGMSGLETTFGLLMRLVENGQLTIVDVARLLCWGPQRVLYGAAKPIAVGSAADLVVFRAEGETSISAEQWCSRSTNTPFMGECMPGRILMTLLNGRAVYTSDEFERRTK